MSSPLHFLESSIGRKVLVSLTGLFLCSFLIIHASGNIQLFYQDDGLAFNQYSLFMTTFLPIKLLSYLLYAAILLHAFVGIRVTLRNRAARPIGYSAPKDPRSASWASKNMAILGIVVLIFLVTHMSNFWYKFKFGDVAWVEYRVDVATGQVLNKSVIDLSTNNDESPNLIPYETIITTEEGNLVSLVVIRDLYAVVNEAFQVNWLVTLYLLGLIALAYHLVHGFQSAFQTLGIRHTSYTRLIQGVGIWLFGIIIPLLFAAMPIYFFFA